jgi:ceramide glucosyltransferase
MDHPTLDLLQLLFVHRASIVLGAAAFALGVYFFGVCALAWHTRKRVRPELPELPPVSILKPLKGDEDRLADNLRTFFAQDYPRFEIVFATTEPGDPALVVARAVAAEFPSVPVRYAHSDADFGLNPKVCNLHGALRAAQHDLVLQSDANVRARPDYLRRVVTELVAEKGSLLSSMVVGVGESSLGGAMENLQLTGMIAPSVCFALYYFRTTCVIGKSMLFRRSELAEMGGLESVKDLLAEDFMLGRAFELAGRKVLLSTTVAENVNTDPSIERFMARHTRWLKMRAVIHVPAFIADLLANPVGLSVFAIAVSGFDPRIALLALPLVATKFALDLFAVRRTRGQAMPLRYLWVLPLKDILLFAVWPYAAISRSIEWRGVKLRLGGRSVLRPDEGAFPIRAVRRMLRPFA